MAAALPAPPFLMHDRTLHTYVMHRAGNPQACGCVYLERWVSAGDLRWSFPGLSSLFLKAQEKAPLATTSSLCLIPPRAPLPQGREGDRREIRKGAR